MKIKIALGALLVVVLVVVAVSLLTGGDDEDDEPTTAQERSGGSSDDGDDGDDDGGGGDAPQLRTVAVERAEGKYAAVAAASPPEEKPKEFRVRVSAAPKQRVKGSWNISCAPSGTDLEMFDVTPPHEFKVQIPTKNPASCIAGGSAQLSGEGRIKVTVLRDR